MSGTEMTDYGGGTERPNGASVGFAIDQDAKVLAVTMEEAIRTSPDSFGTTLVDVASKKVNDWIHEIQSSTWVVAERNGKGVGVAACKHPDPGKDKEDRTESRYIESVWIAPELRGNRLGERLIKYLMHAEYRKSRLVRQYLLWVFPANEPAINLYRRLGFVQVDPKQEVSEPKQDDVSEIKYCLDVNPNTRAAIRETASEAALLAVKEEWGVTYRVLGEGDSA